MIYKVSVKTMGLLLSRWHYIYVKADAALDSFVSVITEGLNGNALTIFDIKGKAHIFDRSSISAIKVREVK